MFKDNNKKVSTETTINGNNRIITETKIKGEINSLSDFRIDGEVEGTINTSGRLVVGRTGVIKGTVICQNADVEGKIEGVLQVKGLLSLKSTAEIQGEVTTEKLSIEPGAVFNVKCAMGTPNLTQKPKNIEKPES